MRLRPIALALALSFASSARADRNDAVLAPLLEVQVLDRQLLAIDAENGGQRSEQVLYTRLQGRVGVVVTDRGLLAIATGSGSWQEARLREDESPPAGESIESRSALAKHATLQSVQRLLVFRVETAAWE